MYYESGESVMGLGAARPRLRYLSATQRDNRRGTYGGLIVCIKQALSGYRVHDGPQ